ncbi:hypothetical protein WA026_000826 [Henosepilachna vigintioctopunctata]|uniref:Protein Wnt n=1 Tax=Henosepilachna vigintioctopunctata TaxID=420089 RepID=A0AAW1V6G0_9CUCU
MNRKKFRSTNKANVTVTCSWLNGCKRQKKICWKRKGLPQILWNARKLAVSYCETQFRFDQWNCVPKVKYFKNIYRETAYMQAIAAASLIYSIAEGCSNGILQGCRCANPGHNPRSQKWFWGGCSINMNFAKRTAEKFLNTKIADDGLAHLMQHNNEIGLKSIQNRIERKCKCHGVSGEKGSCSVQMCWKGIKPFVEISKHLKNEYHNAISTNSSNTVGHLTTSYNRQRLLYLRPTLNLCQTTAGRRCNGTDNCATLCCGRGFSVKSLQIVYVCNCGWRDQVVFNADSLICEQCNKNQNIYICK